MNMKSNCLGRSMVEMLGVLAIIGVLSVGAMAGYSKAMFKYRINKTVTQIATIAQYVRNAYAGQKSYHGLQSWNLDVLKSILPTEMIDENSTIKDDDTHRTAYVISPFGTGVLIDDDTWGGKGYKAFSINYFGLPPDVCFSLATINWDDINVYYVHINNSTYGDTVGEYTTCSNFPEGLIEEDGIAACPGGKVVGIPISPALAKTACDCPNNTCDVILTFE